MKLVIFINDLTAGGAERVAANLANHWALCGWNIVIVTLGPVEKDFYDLHSSIGRVSLGLSGASSNIASALRHNWLRVRALRRVLRQVQPDVALAMMDTSNVLLALAGHAMNNVCLVGSERCYPPHFPLGRIWHALRRKAYGRLDAVVALTSECAAWVSTHTNCCHVPVIPNAASWPMPEGAPRLNPGLLVSPERKVLLAVGRLIAEKNFTALINAFASLAPAHPEWDLVILGEGLERPALEAAMRGTASSEHMHLPGVAGNVGDWYARADLYAMTSLAEGFPNTLAEAQAHGLASVSFDCDTGPRDIIRHGIDGLLVPVGDHAKLRSALDRAMGDDLLRRTMAARAIEARERFSMRKISAQWETLFDELSLRKSINRTGRTAAMDERWAP